MSKHRIEYIEFQVTNIALAKEFYGRLFGWTFKDHGPGYAEFADGRLKGGLWQAPEVRPGGPLVLLQAKDTAHLAELEREVAAAGGRIVKPTFGYPGGHRFHFADPSGNELGIFAEG